MRKLKTVLNTPPRKWILLGRVLRLSAQAWYIDHNKPGKFRPEQWLDATHREPVSDDEIQQIRDVAWAIRKISMISPWENVCRHQAWQAAVLLNKSGLKFRYFVGAKKSTSGQIDGHSWIISGNRFVSGRCNVNEYTIVQQFI